MSIPYVDPKDPADKRPYSRDWTGLLTQLDDTISTSEWEVPDGLDKIAETNDTLTATVRVGGGTDQTTYLLTNHIVTASGDEYERSLYLPVREL